MLITPDPVPVIVTGTLLFAAIIPAVSGWVLIARGAYRVLNNYTSRH